MRMKGENNVEFAGKNHCALNKMMISPLVLKVKHCRADSAYQSLCLVSNIQMAWKTSILARPTRKLNARLTACTGECHRK